MEPENLPAAKTALVARDVGGRPSKYKPEYCEAVIAHMADGASLTSFAAEIGVSRATLTVWAEAHEEFFEAVGMAKAKCAAWWEKQARNIAQGGGGPGAATLCVFGLKNLSPEDWQDKQQHIHEGRITHQPLSYQEAIEEAARRGLPISVLEE